MDPTEASARIEQAILAALDHGTAGGCPPRLAEAMRYAVFPGGARIRPRLCLAVAAACGDPDPEASEAAAAAIELLHCASLVHDDLPCFDDAATRRGKPSVHRAFGEDLALLTGDGLIVLAFESLGARLGRRPARLAAVLPIVAGAVGAARGIVGGQAWECEPQVSLSQYHRAKTGALFAAATAAGAAAAGADAPAWRSLGERLGEAYQVADDLRDAVGELEEIGKPVGRDAALGRPSAARELGVHAAIERLEDLIRGALGTIPDCAGAPFLRSLVLGESERLMPRKLARRVA